MTRIFVRATSTSRNRTVATKMANESDQTFARLRRIEAVAKKIVKAHDERTNRAREMHELARDARRSGKSLSHRVPKQPMVFDLGDLVAELARAVKGEV